MCANNDNHIGAKKDSGINKKQECTGNNIEAALHPIIVVKDARVRARAEMVCRYNAIPLVCGDGNCNAIPEVYPILSTKSRGDREMTEVFKYIGERRG